MQRHTTNTDSRPPALTDERRIDIARMILGPDTPDADVAAFAARMGHAAATLPPLTAEQRDVVAVLLRG